MENMKPILPPSQVNAGNDDLRPGTPRGGGNLAKRLKRALVDQRGQKRRNHNEPPNRTELLEQFRRASNVASASRFARLARTPIRTATVKAASTISGRANRTWHYQTRTFWGATMEVRLPEPVSGNLVRYGLTEPGLTEYLLHFVQPGETFVDIGAHFGYFTLLGAHLVGPEGQIHAFEPTSTTFDILSRNARQVKGVVLNNLAVWSGSAVLTIHDLGLRLSAFNSFFQPRFDAIQAAPKGTLHEVPAVSLDEYCARLDIHPDFVKIDAESAEMEIVLGMGRILIEDRPIVTVEVGDFEIADVPSSAALLDIILAKGYRAYEFRAGRIHPHSRRSVYKYDNILLLPQEHPFTSR
jgi:FkbM family methyltransferase